MLYPCKESFSLEEVTFSHIFLADCKCTLTERNLYMIKLRNWLEIGAQLFSINIKLNAIFINADWSSINYNYLM